MVSGAVPNYQYQVYYAVCELGEATNMFAMTNSRHTRTITPTATGVTFGAGRKAGTMTQDISDDNSTMLPQKIWGIK